ncbi:hypothetical protein [Kocuria sp. SL71]|nr:hypothetical protein [Kocuria sp. SL71]MCY1684872.1 hypothetical protein [Kocuria sp. SL71]
MGISGAGAGATGSVTSGASWITPVKAASSSPLVSQAMPSPSMSR